MGGKIGWCLAGLALLLLAAGAGFLCLFGWEAVETGANVGGWLSLFIPGVVLPLAGVFFCFYKGMMGSGSPT